MSTWTVQRAADELLSCEDGGRGREPLSDEWSELDLATAYDIQDATRDRRVARGERVIGVKLGLTSRAKQRTMNVDQPLVAWLTDAMVLPTGSPVPDLIHPRVEPELLFVLGSDLAGPGITTARAMAAVATVHAAAEVIDSRYLNFHFTLPDVVADNASSGAFVTGAVARRVQDLDLALEAVLVEIDGRVVDSATGAAILGNPGEALAAAANMLGARGIALEAGWVVLAGAMTDAVMLEPSSSLSFHYSSLGSISFPRSL